MKRIFITILSLIFFVYSFAQVTGTEVSMVSYEQGWLDSRGTLALKNNTSENIHNVTFQITYLDMSGNALDYEEFYKEVEIAPGMTKKIDIPAYEHSRDYHYYKSENRPGGSPAFKISFELKDFNKVEPVGEGRIESDYSLPSYSDTHNKDDGPSGAMILLGLAVVVIIIGFVVGMYVLVAVMAQKRKRNVVIWILLSIVTTPILMAIILLVIGDAVNGNEDGYSRIQ